MSGNGWNASFPAAWRLERAGRRITATPGEGAESLVVGTFPLRRAFRPDLWDEAVGELDVVARDLAERLSPLARGESSCAELFASFSV